VAISRDGRFAVSTSADKTVKVWDVEGGLELRTLKGHVNAVWAVAISWDEKRVVSTSDDNTVKVWDVKSGLELATFTCEGAAVCCAFFGSTGVIAGDAGGRVYFLEFDFGRERIVKTSSKEPYSKGDEEEHR
jgi:WD40 repeat protein